MKEEKLRKEPASEDLEQAARECSFNLQLQEYFKKGAHWQREQILKNAVIIEDELVMCYNNGEPTGLSPYEEWWETPEVQNKFKDGDKVKIIIIKD